MKYTIIVIILLVIGGGIAFWVSDMQENANTNQENEETSTVADESSLPVDSDAVQGDETIDIVAEAEYSGTLEDVTDEGTATGEVTATVYSDESYELTATFTDLADPEEGYFYEGWLVRDDPSSVLSTGRAEKEGDNYVNTFQSEENLSDHTEYVLTLEPDDDDPAPADHVLEGTLSSASSVEENEESEG